MKKNLRLNIIGACLVRASILPSLVALAAVGSACQSTATSADLSGEIKALEQQKAGFVASQEDVLAPEQFADFSSALAKAKTLNTRRENAGQEVGRARALAAQIVEKSKPSKAVLSETLAARRKALDAGAQASETFRAIDDDFKSATQDASGGDIDAIQKKRTEFTNRYTNVEGDMIVGKAMGAGQKRFAELKTANADTTAPTTFARTTAKLADAERSIRADRYNPETLQAAATLSQAEVARLVRISSDSTRLKSEPAAIEIFDKEQATIAAKAKLDAQNAALATQNSQLKGALGSAQVDGDETAARLSATEGALADAQTAASERDSLDRKFEDAKKMFNPNEAEVYRDGDNLLIRLKGLSFTEGKGVLPTQSRALLKKVAAIVGQFGSPRVRIEGHTDSTGSVSANAKLSDERAGVVKDYLVSNKVVRREDIVSQGLGESGPVATNETAAGRAQNRRVDVIVQPVY